MTAQLDRDIFGNLLSRKEPAGTRRYYHFDGLGSTTALSDESGAAVATLLYDAWGNQRAATGATVPNYRFTGAELDSASGLYHMGARFYDPSHGRWLSEDPEQSAFFDPNSLNFYTYGYGNPLTFVDIDGRVPIQCTIDCGQTEVLLWMKTFHSEDINLAWGLDFVAASAIARRSVPAAVAFLAVSYLTAKQLRQWGVSEGSTVKVYYAGSRTVVSTTTVTIVHHYFVVEIYDQNGNLVRVETFVVPQVSSPYDPQGPPRTN